MIYSTETYSIELTLGYSESSYTNKLKIDDVEASIASDAATIKQKIRDVNASIAGGTDNGLADFIVANDYDGTGGKLRAIEGAVIISEEENVIYPSGGGN